MALNLLAHVCLCGGRQDSFLELTSFYEAVRDVVPYNVEVVIMGAKIDLKENLEVDPTQARNFAHSIGAEHCQVFVK